MTCAIEMCTNQFNNGSTDQFSVVEDLGSWYLSEMKSSDII